MVMKSSLQSHQNAGLVHRLMHRSSTLNLRTPAELNNLLMMFTGRQASRVFVVVLQKGGLA